ncbi:MAG: hypothetical protein IJX44_02875 [Bacteroidaceae bacterium]|nr:hypothetical protein [Bacteroidaceae bacterium]
MDNLHLPVGMVETVGIVVRIGDAIDIGIKESIELSVVAVDVESVSLCQSRQ